MKTQIDHAGHGGHVPHGPHEHQDHQGHQGAAVGEQGVTEGTIASIGSGTFVLATKEGDLTVVTGADTNYHGLPGRVVRGAGHEKQDFTVLRVGQSVGVMGERQDDATLLAARVHIREL